MFKELFFCLLFILLPVSCTDNPQSRNEPDTKNPEPRRLANGDTLRTLDLCSSQHLSKPQNIQTIGNHLLIETPTDCGYLTLFDPESRQSVSHYFTKDEPSFRYSDSETEQKTVSLYGSVTGILYLYTVDNGTISFKQAVNMKNVEGTPSSVLEAEDGTYIGIGPYRKGLLSLFDKKSRQIFFFGNFPLNEYLPEKGRDYFILYEYNGCIAKSEDTRHIAYASRQFGYLSCYELKGRRTDRGWEKRLSQPRYTRKKDQLLMDAGHQNGFADLRIAGNHIYALYKGAYHDPQQAGLSSPPMKVLVYTLQGDDAGKYILPGTVIHIAVDRKEKYLYTVSASDKGNDAAFFLIRYPL